ncbi:MAG: ATP-binding protein [Acidobacteriota bacterium]
MEKTRINRCKMISSAKLHKYRGKFGELVLLRNELDCKQLELEVKCQALQEAMVELEESQSRFAALYDFAPVGYLTFDGQGCIQEINHTAASLFGFESTQLIGAMFYVFVAQSDLKLFLDHLRRCRRTHDRVITELCLSVRNRAPIEVQLVSVPHYDNKFSPPMYRSVITDISEMKLYEKEMARLDRLNTVGEVAAGIGHEVRNPMTTVRGFLQLYRDQEEFFQHRDSFDLMIDELDRANGIISDFLSMARDKVVEKKPTSLNDVVNFLFPMLNAEARLADMNLQLELSRIPMLFLDHKEIRQLILNLVRNGLESMLPGGTLTVKTFTNDHEVSLTVQDEGKGIESIVLDRIGTPFLTTKDNGTGLGLAVCYSIAARHNALIDINTSPNGTTFRVKFNQC